MTVARGLIVIGRGNDLEAARTVVAVGIVNALGFGVAASLLRAIALQSWADIGHLAAIVALRTVLKRSFASLTFDVESGLTTEGAASRQGTA